MANINLNGLSRSEAAERLKQYGPNRLQPALQRAVLLQFLAHFRNPLVVVLLEKQTRPLA